MRYSSRLGKVKGNLRGAWPVIRATMWRCPSKNDDQCNDDATSLLEAHRPAINQKLLS